MRELKFRAWLDEYKQYLYFGGDFKEQTGRWGKGRCTLAGNNHIAELYANEDNSNMFYQVHKVECIEQCTGLKDKNGKEIYEGDIVRYSHFNTPAISSTTVVDWWSGEEQYYPCCTSSGFSLPFSEDGYEVIGNIHENPELIGENKA